MSIHVMHYAYCDTPGCMFNEERGTDDEFTTRAELLRHLKESGWRVTRKNQYCHLCVDAARGTNDE